MITKENEGRKRHISTSLEQANRISYGEAVATLISIGFGISYLDVISELDIGWIKVTFALTFNLLMCMISVYMLYSVKSDHKNKLGTAQELLYLYTKDRSLIFMMSSVQVVLCCCLSAFALNFTSIKISFYICKIFQLDDEGWKFYLIDGAVVILIGSIIYLFTLIQDYQNYKRLTVVLISAILALILCIIL